MVTRISSLFAMFVCVLAGQASAQNGERAPNDQIVVTFREPKPTISIRDAIARMKAQERRRRASAEAAVVPSVENPAVAGSPPVATTPEVLSSQVDSDAPVSTPVAEKPLPVQPAVKLTQAPSSTARSPNFLPAISLTGLVVGLGVVLLVRRATEQRNYSQYPELVGEMREFAELYHQKCVWHLQSMPEHQRRIFSKVRYHPASGEFEIRLKGVSGFPNHRANRSSIEQVMAELQSDLPRPLPFEIKKVYYRRGWVAVRMTRTQV